MQVSQDATAAAREEAARSASEVSNLQAQLLASNQMSDQLQTTMKEVTILAMPACV